MEVESLDSAHITTQFDLSLSLTDAGESLSGGLQYSSDLFDKTTVQAIMQLFARVLENMVTDAQQSIGQVLDNTPALPSSAHTATVAATVEDEQPEDLPYEAPEGDTEIALANLWKELLKLDKVSRHDDFFRLGGISLMAVQMASRLRKVLGKPIAVRDLFIEPTIAGFARTLDSQTRPGHHSNLVPVRRTGSKRPCSRSTRWAAKCSTCAIWPRQSTHRCRSMAWPPVAWQLERSRCLRCRPWLRITWQRFAWYNREGLTGSAAGLQVVLSLMKWPANCNPAANSWSSSASSTPPRVLSSKRRRY
ncbi:hypothetical protein HG619_20545 [Pseudomonas syringae]|nr:hypothetical protein [Pseudomonas syringae]